MCDDWWERDDPEDLFDVLRDEMSHPEPYAGQPLDDGVDATFPYTDCGPNGVPF